MLAGEDPRRKSSTDYVLFCNKESGEDVTTKSEESEKEDTSME